MQRNEARLPVAQPSARARADAAVRRPVPPQRRRLERTLGNAGVERLLRDPASSRPPPLGLARGAVLGPPDDEREKSAARVAERAGQLTAPVGDVRGDAAGGPLPEALRRHFEPLVGGDLSQVRVHADGAAAQLTEQLSANAVTLGSSVYFARGRYAPSTSTGQRLLAHELAHVVQQRRGPVLLQRDPRGPAGEAARTSGADPGAGAVGAIPSGGQAVGKVGIINRDRPPEVRLRSAPDTSVDNVLRTLPFNTPVQVISRFPGDWLFVATPDGDLGYVAAPYVWTNLPEPNAQLHRVQPGLAGTAIAIAEQHYGRYSDDWGQDLRFYVNVLAWVNGLDVPDTTGGWRRVRFDANDLIWIPSQPFARSLRGAVNSGSISYNVADALGIAGFLDRVGELWSDVRESVGLSRRYLWDAIVRRLERALWNVLHSLAIMLVAAVAILAVSTAIGAAVGALAGGVGAAPGAAAGFEVGLVLLKWLGLASLVVWVGQALLETGAAFGRFLSGVWNARGDERALDAAAREFADAVALLLANLLEALVIFAASKGIGKGIGLLRGTRFGRTMGETRTGEWLTERVRRVQAGEAPLPEPRAVLTRFYRGVEIVDARGRPVGEFDGVDLARGRFVENKSAAGLQRVNPRTGQRAQTEAQWANKQIFGKTDTRIRNLQTATATRPTPAGSSTVPTVAQIRSVRRIHFVIDGQAPALRAAVHAELAALRSAHPGWTFTAEFGVSLWTAPIAPVPRRGEEREAVPAQ